MLCSEDEFDEVVHKSDEEEDDIMSAVAAMKKRDAQLQLQLPTAAVAVADPAAAEESVGPSWSDLEVRLTYLYSAGIKSCVKIASDVNNSYISSDA